MTETNNTVCKAAAVQLKGRGSAEVNLAAAARQIALAVADGADLVVLPEHFVYFNEKDLGAVAAIEGQSGGVARSFFATQAQQHGIWLVAGTLPLFKGTDDSKPYATSLLYDPQGRESARYEKVHLFDVRVQATGKTYRESDSYQHGDSAITSPTDCGVVGLSVCYDLRFPEFYRRLVDQGAEILVAPSAFTATTGEAHWRLLLRARAVENLCYMIGANLCDRDHPTKPTWGGSAIIDPWGQVLAEMDDEEGYITAPIDCQRIATLRHNMPVLEHRRF